MRVIIEGKYSSMWPVEERVQKMRVHLIGVGTSAFTPHTVWVSSLFGIHYINNLPNTYKRSASGHRSNTLEGWQVQIHQTTMSRELHVSVFVLKLETYRVPIFEVSLRRVRVPGGQRFVPLRPR